MRMEELRAPSVGVDHNSSIHLVIALRGWRTSRIAPAMFDEHLTLAM